MLEQCRLFWQELKVDEVEVMVLRQPLTSRPSQQEIFISMSVDKVPPVTLQQVAITVGELLAPVTVMKAQAEELQTLEPAHYWQTASELPVVAVEPVVG
jgi:hypothetical protein